MSWSETKVTAVDRDFVIYRRVNDGTIMEVCVWRTKRFGGRNLDRLWAPTQGRSPTPLARTAIIAAGIPLP